MTGFSIPFPVSCFLIFVVWSGIRRFSGALIYGKRPGRNFFSFSPCFSLLLFAFPLFLLRVDIGSRGTNKVASSGFRAFPFRT